MFAGRCVVIAALDDVPPGLRVGPGQVVMTEAEARAIAGGNQDVAARITRAIDDYDKARLLDMLRRAEGDA